VSREEIIRQIVRRDVEQLGLTEEMVLKEVTELYESACEHFGSWDTALKYAGVRRSRPIKSPERVIQEIRTLCRLGYNLTSTRNMQRDRKLYEAARHHFGSWRKALRAAGVNLENAFWRKPRKLNKQKILDMIRKRRDSGLSLVFLDVCLENRRLATGAKRAFGSWGKALIAAHSREH